MAEKGGTKILVFITICIILITIGFSGCIQETKKDNIDDKKKKNDETDYATSDDLELILKIDNSTIIDNINITIKLKNIRNYQVEVEEKFSLGDGFLDIYASGPNNITLQFLYSQLEWNIKFIILNPIEFISTNISLKDYETYYFIKNNTDGPNFGPWDWNTKGIYKIWATYKINISEEIYSNIVEFEIENLELEIIKNEYSSPYNFIYIYGSIIYEVIKGEYNSFTDNGPLPDEFYKYNPINKTISLYEKVDKKHISAVLFSQYYLNHANSSVANVNYEPFRIINNLPYNETIVIKGFQPVTLLIDTQRDVFLNNKKYNDSDYTINSSWIEEYIEYDDQGNPYNNATVRYDGRIWISIYNNWDVKNINFI